MCDDMGKPALSRFLKIWSYLANLIALLQLQILIPISNKLINHRPFDSRSKVTSRDISFFWNVFKNPINF